MKPFDEYVEEANRAHGHMCAGQILGLRLLSSVFCILYSFFSHEAL